MNIFIEKNLLILKNVILRILSTLAKIVSGLLILFVLLVLFIRSPWGQDIIKDKLVSYLSEQTSTTVSLNRLYISFTGDIIIEELFIQDLAEDTLLYSRSLSADIPIWPILIGEGITIDRLNWDGLYVNVHRENERKGFNYQFLLDTFTSIDTIPSEVSDTSASSLDLTIGTIHLSDIEIIYDDQVNGINASLELDGLQVDMEVTDIQNMIFEVNAARLKNSRLSYIQTKPFPETSENSDTLLPHLALNDIQLNNVVALYRSVPDGIDAHLNIQDFELKAPLVDLINNQLNISNIRLSNSVIQMKMTQEVPLDLSVVETANDEAKMTFEWPTWIVNIDNITLRDNDISYLINEAIPVDGQFNPDAIVLNQLSMQGEQFYLKNQLAGGRLVELVVQEGSGFEVDQFRFLWKMDNQHLDISDLQIKTQNSRINGDFSAQYMSIESLINHPENTTVDLNLSDIVIDVEELYRFQPDIHANPYVQTLALKPLIGHLKLNGVLSSLNLPDVGVQWGNQSAIFASGKLYNATDPGRLQFDFPSILIKSTRDDINQFMHEDSLGIRYPSFTRITGKLIGNRNDISLEAILESTLGQIDFKGSLSNKDTLMFSSEINLIQVQLDTILQNPNLGSLSLTAKAAGQGSNLDALNATFAATIEQFSYSKYQIQNWEIEGNLYNGAGNIASVYQDSNLNVKFNAHVLLDSVSPEVTASIHLLDADLAALGIMDKKVKMAFLLDGAFKGSTTSFTTSATLKEGSVLFDAKSYPLGQMELKAYVTPDTTSGSFISRMMDFNLESNTSPEGFITALSNHLESYLTDTLASPDSLLSNVQVLVDASIREDPLLTDVFLPEMLEMDTMKLKVDFQETDKNLMVNVDIPYLNYSDIEIDSVGLTADSDPDNFNFEIGLRKIVAGPLTVNRTYFTNEIRHQTLYSHFQAQYKNKELIHFKTEISQHHDSIRIRFDPSDLVFDSKDWQIPATNLIRIGQDKIEFKNFKIQSGEQQLIIDDNPGQESLYVRFHQFNIANLISYLNPDTLLASGNLNGQITLEEPWGNAALIADLNINSFNVMQVYLGELSLKGDSDDAKNYEANFNLTGGEMDLTAKGEYHATDNDSEVMLDMAIDQIQMKAIESFSMGSIENANGFLAGKVQLNGQMSDLQYNGQFSFNNASLTPSLLQTPFKLGNQPIIFDNSGIKINNFIISDEDENIFTLNGHINAQNILNPTFNLTMHANDFQVLNASKDENALFYGKASFDADATLTGNLNLPVLKLKLDIGSGTDVTYIMPQGQAALNKRDGIVEFVNKKSPEEILSENQNDTIVIKGYDIDALLSINKEAKFKVVISEQTGDHFEIAGDGDLNFGIDATGRMMLSGIYTLQDGHYEMNLYNLVNRRFDIAEGSTVSWSGDPFDAKLDVRAIYRVETTPASLMANQTSGADPSIQNQYKRKLPFLVYLNVDGQLSEPTLKFKIDMPEDVRGDLGGQVYGMIQQINGDDQLLNKQVFSLLVLSRFYPDQGSDGSSGGIVSVARDNLNQALSDQLNIFSDKLLGDTGLELNFGLDSYTDYQGQNPQNRTQLDIAAQKKFLDDRLIVNVGSEVSIEGSNANSQEENPLIGNVNVEYLLTENGQFRIRGFRKNVFENVIDGQTIVSGLALIFTKEFNQFNELWKSMIREKKNSESKK